MRHSAMACARAGCAAAGDDADPLAADVDAVAVAGAPPARPARGRRAALRVRPALLSAARPTKSSSVLERDGEADPGLERVDLVVELVAGEDQARLDPQRVERLEAERLRSRAPRPPPTPRPRRPGRRRGGTRPRSRARPCSRCARRRSGSPSWAPMRPDEEAEPAQLLERGWRRRRPDDLAQDLAPPRALHGEVVELVGRGLHPRPQPQALGLLAQPDAVVGVAADEAEVVLGRAGRRSRRRASRRSRCRSPCRRPGPTASLRTSRVTRRCISVSASGPSTSNLRSGERSMTTAALAAGPVLGDRRPRLSKQSGSQ